MEFKAFPSIAKLDSLVTITEKIHGTNSAVYIFEYTSTNHVSHEPRMGIRPQSRNRILDVENDNFGFAAWVSANSEALIAALGPGLHFGEWYGSGINSGYGLEGKRFALFDTRFAGKALPEGVEVVPILYRGVWSEAALLNAMQFLESHGSAITPGFMRPEGVVVRFDRNGATFKKVFEAEETGWKKSEKQTQPEIQPPRDSELQRAVWALLHPVRLQKLLSRDERYIVEYPASLPKIAAAYLEDLEKESQLVGVDAFVLRALKKDVFSWIRGRICKA